MIKLKNWKGWTTILLLLVAGYVAGFATSRYLVSERLHHYKKLMVKPGFDHHLFEELNASEELQEKLEPLLQEFIQKWHSDWENHAKNRKELIEQLTNDIVPYLDHDQKESLEHILHKIGRRYKKHHDKKEKKNRNEHE